MINSEELIRLNERSNIFKRQRVREKIKMGFCLFFELEDLVMNKYCLEWKS